MKVSKTWSFDMILSQNFIEIFYLSVKRGSFCLFFVRKIIIFDKKRFDITFKMLHLKIFFDSKGLIRKIHHKLIFTNMT